MLTAKRYITGVQYFATYVLLESEYKTPVIDCVAYTAAASVEIC